MSAGLRANDSSGKNKKNKSKQSVTTRISEASHVPHEQQNISHTSTITAWPRNSFKATDSETSNDLELIQSPDSIGSSRFPRANPLLTPAASCSIWQLLIIRGETSEKIQEPHGKPSEEEEERGRHWIALEKENRSSFLSSRLCSVFMQRRQKNPFELSRNEPRAKTKRECKMAAGNGEKTCWESLSALSFQSNFLSSWIWSVTEMRASRRDAHKCRRRRGYCALLCWTHSHSITHTHTHTCVHNQHTLDLHSFVSWRCYSITFTDIETCGWTRDAVRWDTACIKNGFWKVLIIIDASCCVQSTDINLLVLVKCKHIFMYTGKKNWCRNMFYLQLHKNNFYSVSIEAVKPQIFNPSAEFFILTNLWDWDDQNRPNNPINDNMNFITERTWKMLWIIISTP